MNFIGVDLHKKSITICVMDEKRKVLARKTFACTQTDEIVDFFRQFRPFKVVVEAATIGGLAMSEAGTQTITTATKIGTNPDNRFRPAAGHDRLLREPRPHPPGRHHHFCIDETK